MTRPGGFTVNDTGTPLGPQAVPTFDAVFMEEYPKMVALAAAVSGQRAFAEDLAQDAMTKLHHNWSRIQGFQSPGAWVRRVTINLALSQRRRLLNEAKAKLRLSRAVQHLPLSAAEHEPVWRAVGLQSRLPDFDPRPLASGKDEVSADDKNQEARS